MASLSEHIASLRRALRPEPRWSSRDRSAWLDLSIETGFNRLRDQQHELIRMRTQSVLFVTFLATAIALLVSSGLESKAERGGNFFLLAGIGTGLFGVVAILLILVVAPIVKYDFNLDPVKLLRWSDGQNPSPDLASAKYALATQTLPGMVAHNAKNLAVMRWFYGGLLVAGMGSLGIWTWLVWAFA